MTDSKAFAHDELVRHRKERAIKRNSSTYARAALKKANEALVVGDYEEMSKLIESVSLTILEEGSEREIREYHRKAVGEGSEFYADQLLDFLRGRDRGRDHLEAVLDTLTTIAELQGVVNREYISRATALGFSGTKMGVNLQSAEMVSLGDPVSIVTDEVGTLKTLCSGGTGTGKSTSAETHFEDYYRLNYEGDECKSIDVADFSVSENIFYDVPQADDGCRRARRDQDLPPDFTEIEDYDPSLEVLIPLTPDIEDTKFPYDTDEDEFVPRPFVIPPWTIGRDLFVAVLIRVTKGERDTIIDVYETVDREKDQWTLRDMAEEIAQRDELSDKHRKTSVRTLRSLQDWGFIREGTDELRLDWDDIFTDTKTITAFNQSRLPDETAQLFVLAWLLDQMWSVRRESFRYPQLALALRELWEYAPHSRRDSDSEEASALQERIAYLLTRFMRKNRDSRTHIVADTQQIMDINIGVREMFNRYVVFDGNNKVFENVFSWTSNDEWRSFKGTMTAKTGECGIVGKIDPAINNPNVEYLSPVRIAPPSHHHHDKDDGSGWLMRVQLMDHEELRRPSEVEGVSWLDSDESVAEFDPKNIMGEESARPEVQPVAAFVEDCIIEADIDDYVHKQDVYDAFNEFLKSHNLERWPFDQGDKTRFGRRLREHIDIKTRQRDGEQAFAGVYLSNKGRQYLEEARIEVESSASPIMGDD